MGIIWARTGCRDDTSPPAIIFSSRHRVWMKRIRRRSVSLVILVERSQGRGSGAFSPRHRRPSSTRPPQSFRPKEAHADEHISPATNPQDNHAETRNHAAEASLSRAKGEPRLRSKGCPPGDRAALSGFGRVPRFGPPSTTQDFAEGRQWQSASSLVHIHTFGALHP